MSITSINGYGGIRDLATYRANTPTAETQAEPNRVETEVKQPEAKEIRQAVENLNRVIASSLQSIQFTLDDESGKVVVKVLDSETQKVLRQVPNVEILAISKNLARLQGLVISDKA